MGRAGPEGQLYLPPGFRFYPTDEELVVHYLCKKAASQPFAVPVIAEIDLYKFDPWDLPEKALFGEKEWYFFSPRDRKYPNGSRPNRAAACGYWKATGTDKPIMSGGTHKVGVKKALVFYIGKAPKGTKTNWIMHEYRLADGSSRAAKRKGSLRLDDWVLCRIYKKSSGAQKAAAKDNQSSCLEEVLASLPDIDDSRLMNMNPFKLLNMGEKPNPILFDQPDDHMTDNVSRCAGHGNELCTAWRNSVPNSSFLGFTNKEQNSNVACTDGETAGVTEVGSSRGYAIDAHDPTVPIEIAIQNGYNYSLGALPGLLQMDQSLHEAAPKPSMDSTEEEVQSTFRLHHNDNLMQLSQQLGYIFDNQVETPLFPQLDPINSVFDTAFLASLGVDYLQRPM